MIHDEDLNHNVPALFRHLVENLEFDISQPAEWHFTLRCGDSQRLESHAQRLSERYDVHFQETVETLDKNGQSSDGPPLLSVIFQGALDESQVQAHYDHFKSYATDNSLTYDGVICIEPMDEDAAFGWLDLDGAIWRLRHFTDNGLTLDEYVPFMFAVQPTENAAVDQFIEEARTHPDTDAELVEDEDGRMLAVYISGENNDSSLATSYRFVDSLAQKHGAELLGVQFFEREADEE